MGNQVFRSKPIHIFETQTLDNSSVVNYQDYTPEDLQNMSPSDLDNFYQNIQFNKNFDCSNCKWQKDSTCSLNDTYDSACHGFKTPDPHDSSNSIETHGYVCMDPETSTHCNTNICKEDTFNDKCKITQLDHSYDEADCLPAPWAWDTRTQGDFPCVKSFSVHGKTIPNNEKRIG